MSAKVGILVTLLTAGAYFYYNYVYFTFVSRQKQKSHLKLSVVISFFTVNYLVFMVLSILQFHLIMNWVCFAVLLFFETLKYTKGDRQCALFSTLTGIIFGLAINILCRSALSIITGESLKNFDNHIYSSENLKAIPVFLGFLLAGVVMQVFVQPQFQERLKLILKYRRHTFLLELLMGLFIYLFLNLLIYSTSTNDVVLKAWSIESSLFSMIGFFMGIRYTWHTCVLADYREKNRDMEHELEIHRQEEPVLLQKAIRDPLTGFYNRQHAIEVLTGMLRQKRTVTVCFVDLDGLKEINDQCGHREGDRYIRIISQQLGHVCRSEKDMLFRYGGDEFLLLFVDTPVNLVEGRMEDSLEILSHQENAQGFPRTPSFSYGVIDGRNFSDAAQLISAADRKMYEQKTGKHSARN